jgi:radical SAM family uncharacterized protein
MSEDILLQVNKPARYIGEEWNVSRKKFEDAAIRFGLCFPDLYEVGMSNLGIRIIYSILNSLPDVVCERFFCVCDDLEQKLRVNDKSIFSLESKKPLREFDIIGFSLDSELDYTNVLRVLDLGLIPIRAKDRDSSFPLIIGGGACTMNPEPMHEFFDLFLIGEAEEVILEFIDRYLKHKEKFRSGLMSKADLLFEFAQIEGVYVPSFYEAVYSADGALQEFKPKVKGIPKKIKKRFVKDLDKAHFPLDWLVPYIQIIHDRVTLEIMRGCPNRCRFCQARSQYYPLRLRSQEHILSLADCAYKRTGYEELSLIGLSVTDYPGIDKALESLNVLFKGKGIGISLPSIKAKAGVGNLTSIIAQVKKTGLTFAPEAGSKSMREILAKDFNEEHFFQSLEESFASGYQHVKLYFMIGLPHESGADLDEIVNFSIRVSELRRKVKGSPAQVKISINTLIPKPHTAFQWFAMIDPESAKSKQEYLRNKAKNKRLKLTFHNCSMSFLEGVLSRGDRRLAQVISAAFAKGARFDAWGDHFAIEKWMEAFRETGVDPNYYLNELPVHGILPWDFIDVGIDKETLRLEYNKILQ